MPNLQRNIVLAIWEFNASTISGCFRSKSSPSWPPTDTKLFFPSRGYHARINPLFTCSREKQYSNPSNNSVKVSIGNTTTNIRTTKNIPKNQFPWSYWCNYGSTHKILRALVSPNQRIAFVLLSVFFCTPTSRKRPAWSTTCRDSQNSKPSSRTSQTVPSTTANPMASTATVAHLVAQRIPGTAASGSSEQRNYNSTSNGNSPKPRPRFAIPALARGGHSFHVRTLARILLSGVRATY